MDSFYNPLERNAEYKFIPGGTHRFSITGESVDVPSLYVAKYAVTNERYNRFIDYLLQRPNKDTNPSLLSILPFSDFEKNLLKKAETFEGFDNFLGKDSTAWAQKLRATDDQRFNDKLQPVVDMRRFAATAYCYWLTQLQCQTSVDAVYRLPTETEWEWAAAGREKGGTLRTYPWGNENPDDSRANYDYQVGHTTSVGSYPNGFTPEGLSDMAGNVWELTDMTLESKFLTLRGGSWNSNPEKLQCNARYPIDILYHSSDIGFRVVCVK